MTITPALAGLLAAIRKYEAPKGYGQIYGGAKGVPKSTDVSIMTLAGVQALQAKMVKAGSASTACGGYQFIRKTLALTMAEMKLTGKEVWTPSLQDRMAIHLLQKRGLTKFLTGRFDRWDFANNLALEWASLPVVRTSGIVGSSFYGKKVGQSYYAGDGLNKSHHKPATILALVDALRAQPAAPPVAVKPDPVIVVPVPAPPVTEPRKPPPPPPEPTGFWAWVRSLFHR